MPLHAVFLKPLRFILALAVAITAAACASPEEKRERRENAFDLSGGYRASKNLGSQIDMTFEISNENGRSDIAVKLKRLSDVTVAEREFLKKAGLQPDSALQPFAGEMVLGRGVSEQANGGENISSDFGETSTFYVCTTSVRYDEEHSLRYCLSATAKKSTKKMEGDLILNLTRTRKVPAKDNPSSSVSETTSDETRLHFVTDMSQAFYRQYFGAWSGDCYPTSPLADAGFCRWLDIEKNDAKQTVFARFGGGTVIIFTGRTFVLDEAASAANLDSFRTSEYPSFLSVYRANDSSGWRIYVIGQIWSLGELTGSLVLSNDKTQSEIANFRFKKN